MNLNYGETNADQAPMSIRLVVKWGSSMLYILLMFLIQLIRSIMMKRDFYDVPPYRVNPVSFASEILDERKNRKF